MLKNSKLVEVEVEVCYKTQVVVDAEGLSEGDINRVAAERAKKLGKNVWESDMELYRIGCSNAIPKNFTSDHLILLEYGYPMDKVKEYSALDAESEIQAISNL